MDPLDPDCTEPPFEDASAYTWLGAFALTNQAWFMATLFLLAVAGREIVL